MTHRQISAALVALCCTAASPHAEPLLRAVFVSGSPQNAHAYAATSSAAYETDFPKPLVVRVSGAPKDTTPRVRFTCASAQCRLYALDAPEDFKRIDPRTFEVPADDGKVSIQVSLTTPELGTYTVTAEPIPEEGKARTTRATFRLTAR